MMGKPIGWIAILIMLGAAALAQPPKSDIEKAAARLITPGAERSIERGLLWLQKEQRPDGSWGSGAYEGNTAVTALAGMAFMAAGSTPDRGPHGREVRRAIDYLLANTQRSGFISVVKGAGHGPMYGHGFSTMFLAECYGMTNRNEVRDTLSRAVKLIVQSQNAEGGWRYEPQRAEADVSVTSCQVIALRAARNAGVFVPKETIDRAIEYIKKCQNADGGFRYMLAAGERESGFPRSACALAALFSAGVYEGPEIKKSVAYLERFKPASGVAHRETYYEYGHYYGVQAMWQIGGDAWNRWYPSVRDDLIARQQANGSWPSQTSVEAATAMCVVALALPNNLLPIFQR